MSLFSFGQTWPLDKDHSKIGFTVTHHMISEVEDHSKIGFTVTHHMISEVDGYFKTFTAKLTSAKNDFSDAMFELTAKPPIH